jgi:Spy/CpxP family protein refolding chaperone
MTRSKSMALALYLGAALAGAAVGVAVDRIVFRENARWFDQKAMRQRTFDQLHLTPAQRDSANRIFDDRNHAQDSILAPVRPLLDSASTMARARLTQLLTPEQKAIYDQMQRERQQRDAQRTEKK